MSACFNQACAVAGDHILFRSKYCSFLPGSLHPIQLWSWSKCQASEISPLLRITLQFTETAFPLLSRPLQTTRNNKLILFLKILQRIPGTEIEIASKQFVSGGCSQRFLGAVLSDRLWSGDAAPERENKCYFDIFGFNKNSGLFQFMYLPHSLNFGRSKDLILPFVFKNVSIFRDAVFDVFLESNNLSLNNLSLNNLLKSFF